MLSLKVIARFLFGIIHIIMWIHQVEFSNTNMPNHVLFPTNSVFTVAIAHTTGMYGNHIIFHYSLLFLENYKFWTYNNTESILLKHANEYNLILLHQNK